MSNENTVDEALEGLEEVKKQKLVKQAIIEEIRERAQLALQYKRDRDEAKTKHKRDFYDRKLKKNNEDVPELIEALQRLEAAEEAKDAPTHYEERDVEGDGLEIQDTSGAGVVGGVVELSTD